MALDQVAFAPSTSTIFGFRQRASAAFFARAFLSSGDRACAWL
jgi:hypothetical protein